MSLGTGLASRPTSMNEPKTYYRGHLPHYQPEGATYHVVFRLKGSLPAKAIEELRAEREEAERGLEKTKEGKNKIRLLRELRWTYFERFDVLLDANSTGPLWLKEPEIAEIVKEALHYRDGKVYDLLAYCIMPNHVHMVVGRNAIPTYRILQSLKRHTARKANVVFGRSGAFWQDESYDHVIHDGNELERTIWYVLNNPVKARLVQSWEQWQWTYLKPDLL
jgi:putative transposase